MKQLKRRIFTLILSMSLLLLSDMTVSASGEGNIDGGGGGMGSGTATDVWHNQDGVRITVVTTDGGIASASFDLSNFNIPGSILHFGRVSKLQYSGGSSLSLDSGPYDCSKPGAALPRIISGTRSHASIEAIRRYFCSEYAAQLVSAKSGIPFEELVSGSYKLVIEPIAYFTHGGRNYAMTATEAALYNQKSGGTLRSRMPSLTHQNLPLSIFLETPDLGYPAWNGTTSGKVSDADILSALGIGIVSYKDVPEAELQAPDYTYRVDTDVITSITLTSSVEVNPDNPASVTFHVIPPEITTICRHAQMTTAGSQPMRNFMMRGPAGTGKTEGAKAIAAGLGLPYLYYTCSANTEIYDFLGQMLPETDEKPQGGREYPTLTDIQMDPPSAYKKLTGNYDETITDAEVYDKLLEVMAQDAKALMEDNASGQRFRYVETPLITAIRNGYVIEIQEPTVIANPGVLVGLNALLDRCASVTLTTGEVIHRHPDTVVVVTTNNNYAGCRDMNQSVISRMNLIMDMEEPDVDTLTERTMKVTGCTDKSAVADMAASIQEISERCRETMITDGSCGVRELISWVQSFMVCGNIMEAAKYTVLSSVSSDPENRADILTSCLEQKYAA